METIQFKVYKYRWLVLIVYMLIVAVNQLLWITFAPVTADASKYYNASDMQIGMLSMSFMLVYLVVSIPASWVIDTYGIRWGVGIGAVLNGIFGLTRAFAGTNYNILLLSQIGIAVGQPFILNALTKIAARWFPIEERATASGLGSLAIYLGVLIGMLLTPYLVSGAGMSGMIFSYGIIAIISTVIFLIFIRERPATSPCRADQEERSLAFTGLKNTLHNKAFYLLMLIFLLDWAYLIALQHG